MCRESEVTGAGQKRQGKNDFFRLELTITVNISEYLYLLLYTLSTVSCLGVFKALISLKKRERHGYCSTLTCGESLYNTADYLIKKIHKEIQNENKNIHFACFINDFS